MLTLELSLSIVAIIIAVLGPLGMMVAMFGRFAVVEDRVKTMWDFHVRRGASELTQRGLGESNSPFKISADTLGWFAEMRDSLREFYDRLGRRLTDAELMFEIEKRYGGRILKEVCIPNGLTQGACLLIAAAVAKDENIINLPDQTAPKCD